MRPDNSDVFHVDNFAFPRSAHPEGASVDISHLSFAYPTRQDVPVLEDFSLHVSKGKSVALVGGSGSGKSSVSALMTRLYDPDLGTIQIGGRFIKDIDAIELRELISVVEQRPVLFNTSILDNIRYGSPSSTLDEAQYAAKEAGVMEFASKFPEGLHTSVGEGGSLLSGGQQQRVSIARAILKNSPVVFLDEHTASLDSHSEDLVYEAIKKMMDKSHTTVIIASHRLSTMRSCDEIALIEEGKVAEVGPYAELSQPGTKFEAFVHRQLS